ncbi:MAG: hypothetical protein PHC61_12660, partial [Chitinivibrionales bacterium]|nr:hypothetical protein [Chitinivibrionales bacterium]
WYIFLAHGIDNAGGWSPVSSDTLQAHFQYLLSKQSLIWVAPFVDVARYIRERQCLSVRQIVKTADSIVVRVTDTLSDAVFNAPVTLRRPLPAGWTSCVVLQKGRPVRDSIVYVKATPFVMFNAIPDSGDVTIRRAVTGVLSR